MPYSLLELISKNILKPKERYIIYFIFCCRQVYILIETKHPITSLPPLCSPHSASESFLSPLQYICIGELLYILIVYKLSLSYSSNLWNNNIPQNYQQLTLVLSIQMLGHLSPQKSGPSSNQQDATSPQFHSPLLIIPRTLKF